MHSFLFPVSSTGRNQPAHSPAAAGGGRAHCRSAGRALRAPAAAEGLRVGRGAGSCGFLLLVGTSSGVTLVASGHRTGLNKAEPAHGGVSASLRSGRGAHRREKAHAFHSALPGFHHELHVGGS